MLKFNVKNENPLLAVECSLYRTLRYLLFGSIFTINLAADLECEFPRNMGSCDLGLYGCC